MKQAIHATKANNYPLCNTNYVRLLTINNKKVTCKKCKKILKAGRK